MNLLDEERSMRNVAIYVRVSTPEQKIDGYGLDVQKKRLLEYIEQNKGLKLVTKKEWFFQDVHTGSELNRDGLNELRELVRSKKIDAVLVWKIDRLSRSLKHLINLFEEMQENDVSFISVQENIDFKGPIGKLIFQIFGAIAQFEREPIKGRTKLGKIASAELGNYTGAHVPFGYEAVKNASGKGRRLVIIEEERKWVEQMFNWYIYDTLGLGEITNKLNELKVPKGKGSKEKDRHSPWTEKYLRNIIHNTIYRGEFVANKRDEDGHLLPEEEWTVVDIPPCISEFTFQQAQALCALKKEVNMKKTDYMLSGKLKDVTSEPHRSFVGVPRTKGGYSYRRKKFNQPGQDFNWEIPAKPVEDFVWNKVKQAMQDPEGFIKFYLSREFAAPTRITTINNQLSHLRQQKINTELSSARIEKAYENGSYSEEKMNEKLRDMEDELNHIDTQITSLEDQLTLIGSIDVEIQSLKDASKDVKYRLDSLDDKHKKMLIRLFVDRIEITLVKEGRHKKMTAQIFFRFKPDKFPKTLDEVSTAEPLIDQAIERQKPKNNRGGGDGRNRTAV